MAALVFILDTVFTLIVVAFLLRVLLPLVGAGFRTPIGAAVLKVTDPLVLPLRRLLKPSGRLDVAALVALLIVQLLATTILLGIQGFAPLGVLTVVTVALRELLDTALQFYTVCLLIYVVMSWVANDLRNPAMALLTRLCVPLLQPVRRVVPPLGGLDLSAFIVLIALQALRILLR